MGEAVVQTFYNILHSIQVFKKHDASAENSEENGLHKSRVLTTKLNMYSNKSVKWFCIKVHSLEQA